MSGAALQSLYDQGYAIAASVLGTPYSWYRANGTDNPNSASNLLGSLNAWLTTDAALEGTAQPQYGKPGWYASFERQNVNVGDYLIGANGTFFVAGLEYPAPPFLTWCNRTIAIARMEIAVAPGISSIYSGDTTQNQTPVGSGWPCWLQMAGSGTSRVSTGMGLPSDSSLPVVQVFLPVTAPDIQFNDILTDDLGNKYYVRLAELTPLGWRLSAEQVAQ